MLAFIAISKSAAKKDMYPCSHDLKFAIIKQQMRRTYEVAF